MRMIIRPTIDKTKSKGTMNRTCRMKRTFHLSQGASYGSDGIRRPARSLAPVRRATRRPVVRVRLGGPSAGPVGIQDARTFNSRPTHSARNFVGQCERIWSSMMYWLLARCADNICTKLTFVLPAPNGTRRQSALNPWHECGDSSSRIISARPLLGDVPQCLAPVREFCRKTVVLLSKFNTNLHLQLRIR